jgi:hypothetical protein
MAQPADAIELGVEVRTHHGGAEAAHPLGTHEFRVETQYKYSRHQ